MARAIAVGIPLEMDATLDRETGQSNGFTIPEADRDVYKDRLSLSKSKSIEGIPCDDPDQDKETRFESPVIIHTW